MRRSREYGGNVPIAKMYELWHLPQQLVRKHILKYIYKVLLRNKIKFNRKKSNILILSSILITKYT